MTQRPAIDWDGIHAAYVAGADKGGGFMSDNIFVNGLELVRVKRLAGENAVSSGTEERHFRRAERDLKEQGVMRVWHDENDLMMREQGEVYSMHGRQYITQAQIYAHYPEARNRKHA